MTDFSIQAFYDEATATLTYVVWDPRTRDAVVIDPLLDYDPVTQLTAETGLKKLKAFVAAKELRVHLILETHIHADHLSGARELMRAWPGCQWAMSERVSEVFKTFKKLYAWPESLKLEKLGVSRWFRDGEELSAGSIRVGIIATPGHTPACTTLKIGTWLFTGDTLFMPDSGVGRCDFPGGSAASLYESIWGKLYALPDDYTVFVGHDYRPGGRPLEYQCSLGQEKLNNIHIKTSTTKADFIAFREGRDKTLQAPRLLEPSLNWNLGAKGV